MNLLARLKKEGFDPVILAPSDDYSGRLMEAGYTFYPLKYLSRKGTNPLRDLLFLGELYRLFHKIAPDLVLLYTAKPNIYGSIATRWLKIPAIATVTGLGYTFISKSLTGTLIRKMYNQAFSKIPLVVFHNPDDRDLFLKNRWVDMEKSIVIRGSGIDLAHFSAAEPKEKKETFNFLFIGRLLYDKGIRELLQAFDLVSARQEHVTLKVLGRIDPDNPSSIPLKEWQEWIAHLPRLEHTESTSDVRPHIRAADVVVLPSYREGLPRTILEAMAMKTPVIVTDVPGCRETILPGSPTNGYLCQVRNPASLAVKMEAMMALTSEERKSMGAAGRRFAAADFGDETICLKYLSEIKKLLL